MATSMQDVFAHMFYYHATIFLIFNATVTTYSIFIFRSVWGLLKDDIWRRCQTSTLIIRWLLTSWRGVPRPLMGIYVRLRGTTLFDLCCIQLASTGWFLFVRIHRWAIVVLIYHDYGAIVELSVILAVLYLAILSNTFGIGGTMLFFLLLIFMHILDTLRGLLRHEPLLRISHHLVIADASVLL